MVSNKDIGRNIRGNIEGEIGTYIFKDNDRIPVRVVFAKEYREDIGVFNRIKIINQMGVLLPIEKFIKKENNSGINEIKHFNSSRDITVTANIDESVTSSNEVNSTIVSKFSSIMKKHKDVYLTAGGYIYIHLIYIYYGLLLV